MVWRKAFVHPLAWVMLATSLALAGVAALELRWSGQEAWLALWGVAAYLSIVLYTGWANRAVKPAPSPQPEAVVANDMEGPRQDLLRLTEHALKHLGNPSVLATSGLVQQLPLTLAASSGENQGESLTPLENAQRLRLVLDTAMSKLLRLRSSEGGAGHPEALQYQILQEHYVSGRPASYSMARYSISERTFHRYRVAAIRAIADDLTAQEAILKQPTSSSRVN